MNGFFEELEHDPNDEQPSPGDRKLIAALDGICKGTFVLLVVLFLAACVRAVATGAVDRLVR